LRVPHPPHTRHAVAACFAADRIRTTTCLRAAHHTTLRHHPPAYLHAPIHAHTTTTPTAHTHTSAAPSRTTARLRGAARSHYLPTHHTASQHTLFPTVSAPSHIAHSGIHVICRNTRCRLAHCVAFAGFCTIGTQVAFLNREQAGGGRHAASLLWQRRERRLCHIKLRWRQAKHTAHLQTFMCASLDSATSHPTDIPSHSHLPT